MLTLNSQLEIRFVKVILTVLKVIDEAQYPTSIGNNVEASKLFMLIKKNQF